MHPKAFFILLACLVAVFAIEQDEACSNLKCEPYGTCQNGTVDYSDHPTDEYNKTLEFLTNTTSGEYSCKCDPGRVGVHCKTQVEICGDSTQACYHGGKCLKAGQDETGSQVHVCDCRTAIEHGILHLGAYCQNPSPFNHPEGNVSGAEECQSRGHFCLNGGRCDDSSIMGEDACICEPDYVGFHCEFHKSQLTSDQSKCIRKCGEKGSCQIGLRNITAEEFAYNLNMDPNDVREFEHCQCAEGFTGANCEQEIRDCGNDENPACVQGECDDVVIDDTTDSTGFVCTCKSNSTHSFAGVGCSMPSTSLCTSSEGVNGRQFCTNYGKCVWLGDGIYGCNCTAGFHGYHCEFPPSLPAPELDEEDCNLACQNNGVCHPGVKDHGMLVHVEDIEHLLHVGKNSTTESTYSTTHCICPTGYAGTFCEHVVEVCPGNEHVCFHGSKCVEDGDDYKCDCDASGGEEGIFTAGESCQYKATSECDPASGVFCVNNGFCDGGGCTCPEPYSGPRCEFKVVMADFDGDDPPENYEQKANSNLLVFTGVMAAVGVLSIIVIVMFTNAHTESSDPGLTVPPMSAFHPSAHSPEESSVSGNTNVQECSVSANLSNEVDEAANLDKVMNEVI